MPDITILFCPITFRWKLQDLKGSAQMFLIALILACPIFDIHAQDIDTPYLLTISNHRRFLTNEGEHNEADSIFIGNHFFKKTINGVVTKLKKNSFINELASTPLADWENVALKSRMKNCDTLTPFVISIRKGNALYLYTVCNTDNCYLSEISEFMKRLSLLFDIK